MVSAQDMRLMNMHRLHASRRSSAVSRRFSSYRISSRMFTGKFIAQMDDEDLVDPQGLTDSVDKKPYFLKRSCENATQSAAPGEVDLSSKEKRQEMAQKTKKRQQKYIEHIPRDRLRSSSEILLILLVALVVFSGFYSFSGLIFALAMTLGISVGMCVIVFYRNLYFDALEKCREEYIRESTMLTTNICDGRASSFMRREGYEYHLVLIDWANDAVRDKGFHLALKHNNKRIYVYDFAPRDLNLFRFGDRLIDVDGRQYIDPIAIKIRVNDAYMKEWFTTCIVERPVSDEASENVALTMQSEKSSFPVIISFFVGGKKA